MRRDCIASFADLTKFGCKLIGANRLAVSALMVSDGGYEFGKLQLWHPGGNDLCSTQMQRQPPAYRGVVLHCIITAASLNDHPQKAKPGLTSPLP